MAAADEVNELSLNLQGLQLIQHGVYSLGENVEGWLDMTLAAEEELKRQREANERFFVTDLPLLPETDDPCTFNVMGMKGAALINLLRHVIEKYRKQDIKTFYVKFTHDKKFEVKLIPSHKHPGNGLVNVVGQEAHTYPQLCAILTTSGVTSKDLGEKIFKLNTEGMHNSTIPINELHFLLLFEVARRLVRGDDGRPVGTEPELDQLPIGAAVARIIQMLMRGEEVLHYNDVFGKFNCFSGQQHEQRSKRISALNKVFFEKLEKEAQAVTEGVYVIKTVPGFLEELKNNFGEM